MRNSNHRPFPSWTWASLKPCQSDSEVYTYLAFYTDEFSQKQVFRCLDRAIQILVYDLQGTARDIVNFAEHHGDSTCFRPLLEITGHAVLVSTVEQVRSSEPPSTGISAFPHAQVWWQQEPPCTGTRLVAPYMGTTAYGFEDDLLVFILVQETSGYRYRRVGVFHVTANIVKIENWDENPKKNEKNIDLRQW
jgi:hypothetical protein